MEQHVALGADKVGTVWAISAETGRPVKHEQRAGTMSLAATGGGLVFGGDARVPRARRQDREVLWETNLAPPSADSR